MKTKPQVSGTPEEILVLRQEVGLWLKSLREKAGLTQRELSDFIGLPYYTFISQIEAGRGRVAPDKIEKYAVALKQSPRDFAIHLMRYYDPINHAMIFGSISDGKLKYVDTSVEARLAKLESLLGNENSL